MRNVLVLVFVLAACSSNGGVPPGPDAPDMGSEQPAFTVVSKDVTLMPGDEVTYCYYFHTPNTKTLAIKRWSSDMAPGSHHMIMFFGAASQPADGTLSTDSCGAGGGAQSAPIWVYASQTPHQELALPTDDGAGKPLGMNVPANQPAYFQMHYLNATDQPLVAHVTLNAFAHPDGAPYTQTAAFITYNDQISIPPHATGHVESLTCQVPSGVKFWTMSTHAHKQAVETDLKDGSSMVFQSHDWEHPGAMSWSAMPFFSFGSGAMTYTCTYDNTGSNAANTIVSGPSAKTNEMCMGTGYFFPATGPKFCYNNIGPI